MDGAGRITIKNLLSRRESIMQTQVHRGGSVLAIGALLAVASSGPSIAKGAHPPETTLLGITLLKSSYRDVLKRYGRPDEIQAGGPYVPSEGEPSAAPARGGMGGPMMGGAPGMPGMSGPGGPGGGGGKKATSKTGFIGRSGTGAAGPGMGGYPGMGGGSPAAPGAAGMGGGLPGFGGYPGMGGSSPGYPGMSSPGGFPSSPGAEGAGMPGMGGSGGASGGADANAEPAEYEATWWYHDKANGLHKSFLFNKDGRVIQVQEYGYDKHHKGGKTRLGVGLGSGLNQVLRTYGWSDDGANEGRNLIMRFGGEDKVAFQLVNNIVVGVTIAVVKDAPPAESP
jgi:hypothetical protein